MNRKRTRKEQKFEGHGITKESWKNRKEREKNKKEQKRMEKNR